MAARTSPKKSLKKTRAKVGSTPSVERLSLYDARRVIEASYSLHLVLLLTMTILAALLLWIVVKQQNTIDSLDFQLRFVRERYDQTRTWNGELLEYKTNGADTYNDAVDTAQTAPQVE